MRTELKALQKLFKKRQKHFDERFNQSGKDWHLGLSKGWEAAAEATSVVTDYQALSVELSRLVDVCAKDVQRSRFARAILGMDRYKEGRLKALKDARNDVANLIISGPAYLQLLQTVYDVKY